MIVLTRRHVIASLTGTAVTLCPALLNAQSIPEPEWGDVPYDTPVGEMTLTMLDAGPAEIDASTLQPGEVAVVGRPTTDDNYSSTGMVQYVAIMRRTEAQIAFGAENDRDGTVQDPNYFVVNLLCTHRGKAIGITGNPDAPFACTDRRGRHGSIYNAVGFGVAGASEDEYLSIPDYALTVDGDQVVVALS
ncbi:MAG: hypothetical protein AAFQ64_20935 [Pseudomonadota bacterium]